MVEQKITKKNKVTSSLGRWIFHGCHSGLFGLGALGGIQPTMRSYFSEKEKEIVLLLFLYEDVFFKYDFSSKG